MIFFIVILAFYGVLFLHNEEAAFSNYRMWESLGFIAAFILNNEVCTAAHTWIVTFVLIAGITGYLCIEAIERGMFGKKPALTEFQTNGSS